MHCVNNNVKLLINKDARCKQQCEICCHLCRHMSKYYLGKLLTTSYRDKILIVMMWDATASSVLYEWNFSYEVR